MPCFHEGSLLRLLLIDNYTAVIRETGYAEPIKYSRQQTTEGFNWCFSGKQVLQCRTEDLFGMYKISDFVNGIEQRLMKEVVDLFLAIIAQMLCR